MLGGPTAVSVASARSRSAPNTTALQLVRVTPCDLGAVSRAPEIASKITLMYFQRLDRFLDCHQALALLNKPILAQPQSLNVPWGPAAVPTRAAEMPRILDPGVFNGFQQASFSRLAWPLALRGVSRGLPPKVDGAEGAAGTPPTQACIASGHSCDSRGARSGRQTRSGAPRLKKAARRAAMAVNLNVQRTDNI